MFKEALRPAPVKESTMNRERLNIGRWLDFSVELILSMSASRRLVRLPWPEIVLANHARSPNIGDAAFSDEVMFTAREIWFEIESGVELHLMPYSFW